MVGARISHRFWPRLSRGLPGVNFEVDTSKLRNAETEQRRGHRPPWAAVCLQLEQGLALESIVREDPKYGTAVFSRKAT